MAHKPGTMSWDNIYRRAGGRRGYNSRRHFLAVQRRRQVARLLLEIGTARGYQRRLARELSVSPVTICKDIAAIFGRLVSPEYARMIAILDRRAKTEDAAEVCREQEPNSPEANATGRPGSKEPQSDPQLQVPQWMTGPGDRGASRLPRPSSGRPSRRRR